MKGKFKANNKSKNNREQKLIRYQIEEMEKGRD